MDDITEKDIEQFVRFPEKLSAEKRMRVEEKIASSDKHEELAAFFREYHTFFTDIVSQARRAHTVPLTLFEPEVSESPHRLVLAAQTSTDSQELRTIATLASEEDETLVRILKERDETYRIHVISKLLDSRDRCILSLTDIGVDLVINEEGRLRFSCSFDLEGYDWDSASYALRLPVKRFSVPVNRQYEKKEQTFEHRLFSLEVKQKNGTYTGNLQYHTEEFAGLSRAVVKGSEGKASIIRISEDRFTIPVTRQENMVSIWFYE